MPPAPKSGGTLFLGLELAVDQLRASIVDENLELAGVEYVDFDAELSEYQTQGGIFTTPGEAYTTPVEMWVKALDFLLEKLQKNYDLTRIRSIGGSAQHALVWWKSSPIPGLPVLDPRLPLHSQLAANTFSLPNVPTSQDSAAHTHALALEAALGGPDLMSVRVGTCGSPALVAAQLLRVREAWPEVWGRTGRVQMASSFLASLICGTFTGISESEACATGMWNHGGPQGPSQWDDGVLDIVGGSRDDGRKIRAWLGDVDLAAGGKRIGTVSKYLVDRYGFDPDTIVTPFTSDYLSSYLSLCPTPSDAVLAFGPMDLLMTPAQQYVPTRLYNLYPHPALDSGEKRRYIAILTTRNADVPRALVRDMYTKSWSAFDRLVAIVPPGGSIGLDDKLFSFWFLQGDTYPFSHVKGIFRFETGIKVNEFRDLRANPRCLVESQILSFRVRWSRMLATGVLGPTPGRGKSSPSVPPHPPLQANGRSTNLPISQSLGLAFDPYDYSSLPLRILTTGAASNFPSVANLVGDVFNAVVSMPTSQVDSAQLLPHRNAPAPGFPSRAALGGAYVARWVWGKERERAAGLPLSRSAGGVGMTFEEEVKRLLGKRWATTGGAPARTNVNGIVSLSASAGSAPGSGTSTPYGHGHSRSGLGSTVLVEEDEDELILAEREDRLRTFTSSTTISTTSTTSTGMAPSTAFTTPDLSGGVSPSAGTSGSGTGTPAPPSTTTLVPVSALPSTSEADLQAGIAKVAEPDVDAFMAYASLVPEYCRLEGLLVKGLV
ncbi:hypothetical protein JAAARDRAFT_200595 [Jaapia argillacea MUCL 33604]|uniref:Actin-like ATPase domain-containing protein n=1 Tax=Jaapia argillacea MUCL 33604 TaxID=933084 RepID=A0A067P4C6_9AGAM|nr:hypothetical protein JAAARDRAFT_200595 [Jaapia argillacea MUCL 33604]